MKRLQKEKKPKINLINKSGIPCDVCESEGKLNIMIPTGEDLSIILPNFYICVDCLAIITNQVLNFKLDNIK